MYKLEIYFLTLVIVTHHCKEVCVIVSDFHIEINHDLPGEELDKIYENYLTIEQAYDFEISQLCLSGFYAEVLGESFNHSTWFILKDKITEKLVKDILIWGENPAKIPIYE